MCSYLTKLYHVFSFTKSVVTPNGYSELSTRNAWQEFLSISTEYGSTNELIREFNIIHSVNCVRSHLYVPTYGHKLHKI
jgi:hypothetical protein